MRLRYASVPIVLTPASAAKERSTWIQEGEDQEAGAVRHHSMTPRGQRLSKWAPIMTSECLVIGISCSDHLMLRSDIPTTDYYSLE